MIENDAAPQESTAKKVFILMVNFYDFIDGLNIYNCPVQYVVLGPRLQFRTDVTFAR